MGTSSEDVLLMMPNVRHKKYDGSLYLMAERIAWMPNGKEILAISHPYADIKTQKISPDGKPKVQLQVLLNSGDSTTFRFVNNDGQEAQLADRNTVKEMLQQLLPKFKRKLNSDLEEKNKILTENPKLFELYKILVVGQVIPAEQFWKTYGPRKKQETQQVGVSGAFLVDVKPQSDGCNGIRYNISADIMESIFKTYPAVRKKHLDNVPNKMTEEEFWTAFFQSHYFHRDRLATSSRDLFTDCAKADERDVTTAIASDLRDPLLDLGAIQETSFGDFAAAPASATNSVAQSAGRGINQSLIRRFNHHSLRVLKTALANEGASVATASKSSTTAGKAASEAATAIPGDEVEKGGEANVEKVIDVREKVRFDDLESDDTPLAPLKLAKTDRYQHGGGVSGVSGNAVADITPGDMLKLCNQRIDNWDPSPDDVLSPSSALSVLGELSPGGALMKNHQQTNIKGHLPDEVQVELQALYTALMELLRHFWACFPATTAQLEAKAHEMRDVLERFLYARLQPFCERLSHQHMTEASHIVRLVQMALDKYSAWKSKRVLRK